MNSAKRNRKIMFRPHKRVRRRRALTNSDYKDTPTEFMADRLSLSNNQNSVRLSAYEFSSGSLSNKSGESEPIVSKPNIFLKNPKKRFSKRSVSSIGLTHEIIPDFAKFENGVFFDTSGRKAKSYMHQFESNSNEDSSNHLQQSFTSLQRADAQYFDSSSNRESESRSNSVSDMSGDSWIKHGELENHR